MISRWIKGGTFPARQTRALSSTVIQGYQASLSKPTRECKRVQVSSEKNDERKETFLIQSPNLAQGHGMQVCKMKEDNTASEWYQKKKKKKRREKKKKEKRSVHETASIDEGHTQKLLEALRVGFLPLCNRLGGLVLSGSGMGSVMVWGL